MNGLTSAAKAAALIIGVLISGGVADLAYAEQRPGDCGYYINSNGHRVPSPCGNSKTDAPPPRQPQSAEMERIASANIPMRAERAPTMAASRAI